MLSSVGLDAVVISTPHAFHYGQARACLERGVHVLIDKPPALHSKDTQALADLAHSKGCCLAVASQRRYDPLLVRFRDKFQNGSLGEVSRIRLHYNRSKRLDFATSWRNDPVLSGGGVLFDAGYHLIDSLLWIADDQPLYVQGRFGIDRARVETSASLILGLGEATLVEISVHLEMPPSMVWEDMELYGSQGAFVYQRIYKPSHISSAFVLDVRTEGIVREKIQNDRVIDQAPARNFINAILHQEPLISSGDDSIRTVRTIEWIYEELAKA
jgi:predicted dehydrogenase